MREIEDYECEDMSSLGGHLWCVYTGGRGGNFYSDWFQGNSHSVWTERDSVARKCASTKTAL